MTEARSGVDPVEKARSDVAAFAHQAEGLRTEIGKVIVGHDEIVEGVLIALFVGGHVLLEGVPGLGKTLLVKTLARCVGLEFSRIQFTPDLMPADILGTRLVVEDDGRRRRFEFQKGPVFAHVLLADEINRATPKTQSALLEAMQERSVTAGGETHILEEPFLVLATQNPLEMEGTYPLPEAQLDRFLLKLLVKPQDRDDLLTILRRTTGESLPDPEPVLTRDELLSHARLVRRVATAPHVEDFVVRLVLATQPGHALAPEPVRKYVRYGSSPRGAQALLLAAKVVALLDRRYHVAFEDVEKVARAALRHRLLLGFEADTDGVTADTLLEAVLEAVPRAVE